LIRHLDRGSQEVRSKDRFEKEGGCSALVSTITSHYQQRATTTTGPCYRTTYKFNLQNAYQSQPYQKTQCYQTANPKPNASLTFKTDKDTNINNKNANNTNTSNTNSNNISANNHESNETNANGMDTS
jgi:predicted urease superfamily metal-dependent hydrolase